MNRRIQVITPDGREHTRVAADPAATLSTWLEAAQLPLNTRCGGRGLCRGCLIEVAGHLIPACQHYCGDVSRLRIPEASLRDHRINGVSTFEIGPHGYTPQPRQGIGLALDIGTTTVAAALWDLASGQCLAHGSAANEQRRFGDNVLARINHAVSQGGISLELQSALIQDSLQPLVKSLCEAAGIVGSAITEAVAAGNTVMQHSLAAADLSGFAAYPFRPAFLDACQLDARAVGLPFDGPLMLTANLGPFVGADIAVGAFACGMLEAEGPALLIDFGTNGELLLKTRQGYLATATAAGPAFEGGRLNCGSIAGQGVLASLDRADGHWQARDSEGAPPSRSTGISGAAYIDFLHHARVDGLLNQMGRFDSTRDAVTPFEIDGASEQGVTVHQQQFVTETDVAELMQAKAAIAAGALTLLQEAGLQARELATIYVAGGFGFHLNYPHAMAIGLLPAIGSERIRIVGNASLGGASLMLQCGSPAAVEQLRRQCRIIELNQIDHFEDHFIDCMALRETPAVWSG